MAVRGRAVACTQVNIARMTAEARESNLLAKGGLRFDLALEKLHHHLDWHIRNIPARDNWDYAPSLDYYPLIPLSKEVGHDMPFEMFMTREDHSLSIWIEILVLYDSETYFRLMEYSVHHLVSAILGNIDAIAELKYPGIDFNVFHFKIISKSYKLCEHSCYKAPKETCSKLVDIDCEDSLAAGWRKMVSFMQGRGDYHLYFVRGILTLEVCVELYDETPNQEDAKRCDGCQLCLPIECITVENIIIAAMQIPWSFRTGNIDKSLYRFFAIGYSDTDEGRIAEIPKDNEKDMVPYITMLSSGIGMLGNPWRDYELKACLISTFGETNSGDLLM